MKIFYLAVFLLCFSVVSWIWNWAFIYSVKIFVTLMLSLIGGIYFIAFVKEIMDGK